MNQLKKYKIGLAVIGVFTVGLLIILLVQAGGTRQDNETYEKASKIADKLDSYVISNGIPESLEEAGINDVPDEVSYEKLSDERYKFCVTYKTKSSGFDSNEIWYTVATGGSAESYESDSEEESSYLYLSPIHDKGENCQTIYDPYASEAGDYDYSEYDYESTDYLQD